MPGVRERLSIKLLTQPDSSLIADVTGWVLADDSEFGTNEHGYSSATIALDVSYSYAMWLRAQLANAHLVISDGALTAFEGRVEDRRVEGDRLTITALGYQRSFTDLPYTALWIDTKLERWRDVVPEDGAAVANVKQDMFVTDENNRIFIGMKKNQTYDTTDSAYFLYIPPSAAVACSFTYSLVAPANMRARLYAINSAMTAATPLWTITSAGAVLNGTANLTFAATDRLLLELVNTGVNITYPAEDGTDYLKITDLTVKGTTSANVYLDEIARALVANVRGTNPNQLNSSTALIQSPSFALSNEVYEDESMIDILNRLTALGDASSPPRQWEWGVWDDRRMVVRPRGSAGQTWYIDTADPTVEDTLDSLYNSVYGVYTDDNSRTRLRTAMQTDSAGVARLNLTRRRAIDVDSAPQTAAVTAALQDSKTPPPRISIPVDVIKDVNGGERPKYTVRSGDTITLPRLPVNLSTDVDRVRTFRIAETRYTLNGELTVTPEQPLPTLDVLLARRAAGFTHGDLIGIPQMGGGTRKR